MRRARKKKEDRTASGWWSSRNQAHIPPSVRDRVAKGSGERSGIDESTRRSSWKQMRLGLFQPWPRASGSCGGAWSPPHATKHRLALARRYEQTVSTRLPTRLCFRLAGTARDRIDSRVSSLRTSRGRGRMIRHLHVTSPHYPKLTGLSQWICVRGATVPASAFPSDSPSRASSLPLCGHTRGEALSLWTVSRSHSWYLRRRGSLLVPFARFPAGSESPSLPGICACLTSDSGPLFPGNWSSERWGRHDGHVPGNKRPGAKTFPFRLPQVFCCLLKLSPLGLVAARCKCRSQLDKHKITQVEKFVKGLVYII